MSEQAHNLLTLAQRVEKLEKQNRRLKRGALAAFALFGSVFLMGQMKEIPRVVEAQEFILRDAKGNLRAKLTLDKRDVAKSFEELGLDKSVLPFIVGRPARPALKMYSEEGTEIVSFGIGPEESGLFDLNDLNGNLRIRIGIEGGMALAALKRLGKEVENQELLAAKPYFAMYDEQKKKSVSLGVSSRGNAQLVLHPEQGKNDVWLSAGAGGVSRLSFYDQQGTETVDLGMGADETTYLNFSKDRKKRVVLGANAEMAGLLIYDPDGKVRSQLGFDHHGPALRLHNADEGSRLVLTLVNDDPYVILAGSRGTVRAQIHVQENVAGLWLYDASGKSRAVLGVVAEGDAVFSIKDEKGNIIWVAP